MNSQEITDLRYVRGHIVVTLYVHDKAHPGDALELPVLKRVLRAAYPQLDEKALKGQLSWLQDRELIEPVIDDDLPLELQSLAAGLRITRRGRAVAEGDALVSGLIVTLPEA